MYRGTASGGESLLTTLGSVLTYTSTGLTNGQTYYYKVSAINSIGEGSQSSEVSGTPLAGVVSAKFTVTASSGTYTAKRADGSTFTSGTNAATVINAALNGLTVGRTTKEKVSLQGTFTLTGSINTPSYSILDATGANIIGLLLLPAS